MATDQPPVPYSPRYTRTQRRLLSIAAGLGVAVVSAGVFVVTYADLRELALAGGVERRWAPAYPVMVDGLITVTVLALVAARNARWWSRLPRWGLLVVTLGGAAAASVQRAVEGYEPLPDDALKAGVAIAPYVMLALAVWLWLGMFRQLRLAMSKPSAEPSAEPETPALPPARGPWLFAEPEPADEPASEPPVPAAEEDPRVPEVPPVLVNEEPEQDEPRDEDETPPSGAGRQLLPTDVELIRHGSPPVATTTQPDMVIPPEAVTPPPEPVTPIDPVTPVEPAEPITPVDPADPAEDDEGLATDRAEDPDAGDDDPPLGRGRHRLRNPGEPDLTTTVEWPPPATNFRSSPTPPGE